MASGSGPSSWLRSKAPKAPEHSTGLELTQYSQSAGRTLADGAGLGEHCTQPLPIQPNDQQQCRYDSGGSAELPSALGTPPKQAAVHGDPVQEQAHDASRAGPMASKSQQEQQQQQQQQGPDGTSSVQKGVHWLPGLQAAGALVPAAPATGLKAKGPPTVPSAVSGLGAATGASSLGSADDAAGQHDAASDGRSQPSSSRAAPLPTSDDQQLDNYLRYLLQEQHPHKFLYYVGWSLTCEGCAAIGEFLRRDKRIKVVTLSGNSITDEGLELIAEGLAHNGSVLSLDLSDNRISSVGAIELAEALHSDKCKVAELLLANNRIGDDGADALAAAVASSTTLKKLKLSGNTISAAQLDVVSHVLKTREYKWSGQRTSSSKSSRHMRKVSSGLQFDIELTSEGQSRNSSSNNLLGRRSILRLPPGVAVAALTEAKDPLESSIGVQAAHLLAELQEKARHSVGPQAVQQPDSSASTAQPAALEAAATQAAGGCHPNQPSLAVMLAVRLACRGYDVVLRTCLPALDNSEPDKVINGQHKQATAAELVASGLRHTFVRVSQPVPAEEAVVLPTVIVDPLFADQFQMPHPTKRLQEALDALPRVLCLAEARLFHLVDLLCTETAAAFKEARLSLPPWRSTPSVMDKWLSERYHDVAVDADSSPQALEQAIQAVVPVA